MDKELITLTKKSGVVFFGNATGALLGLLFTFAVAHLIGAKIYGQFVYVYGAIGFFPVLLNLGLDQGLVYYIPKFQVEQRIAERNSLIRFSMTITVFLAVIAVVAIFFQSRFITGIILNNPESEILLKIIAPLLLGLLITQQAFSTYRAIGDIKTYVQIQNLFFPLIKLVAVISLALMGYKMAGLIFAFYLSIGLSTVLLIMGLRRYKLFDYPMIRELSIYRDLLIFSSPLLLNNVAQFLTNKIGIFGIGYFLSATEVGVYNIALRVGTASSFILGTFSTMFAPLVAKLFHQGKFPELAGIYKTVTKWAVAANLIFFSLLLLCSRDVMRLFGPDFISGSNVLIIIGIGQVISSGVGSAGIINVMTGRPQYALYTNLATFGLSALSGLLLIPRYGIMGAALTSLIAVSSANIIRLILVYTQLKIHPYDVSYLKVILATVLSFAVMYLLKPFCDFNWFWRLLVLSGGYLIFYLIISIALGVNSTDKEIIGKVIRKILPKNN